MNLARGATTEPVRKRSKRPDFQSGNRGFESHPVHQTRDVAQPGQSKRSGTARPLVRIQSSRPIDGECRLTARPRNVNPEDTSSNLVVHPNHGSLAQRQSTRPLTGEMRVQVLRDLPIEREGGSSRRAHNPSAPCATHGLTTIAERGSSSIEQSATVRRLEMEV